MAEENSKEIKTSGIKIFLVLAFVAIGFLCYKNYELNIKLNNCNEKLQYYVEQNDEFHKNLYAQVEGSYRDGAHALSISDIYYRKYFKSSDDK